MPESESTVEQATSDIEGPLPLEQIEGTLRRLLEMGDKGPGLAVDTAIRQAIHHRSSDVHFEPWHDCLALRYRLDGALHGVAVIPKEYQERIIARIKVLSDLIVYQKETPQDGRIDAHEDRLNRALRVSTFPTIYGEKTVIRILDPYHGLLRLESLGFAEEVVTGLRRLMFNPQGTLLLTGPSSSGKTTTIYAILRELMAGADASRNIVTIEDPVEYRLGRIAQTQINPNLGFTFVSAFRSLLRQDPDIIMVGEIRDADTARTAIQAGLTGHLVISTIHSGTAAGVFTRVLDMGIEPFLVASSITGVLAQRLIRTNCTHCARPYNPPQILKDQYLIPNKKFNFKRGKGCSQCRGIGFRGRLAIGELLPVGEEMSDLILTRALTRKLQEAALRNGMATILHHGLQKAANGESTLEELQAVVPAPEDLDDEAWKNAVGGPLTFTKAPKVNQQTSSARKAKKPRALDPASSSKAPRSKAVKKKPNKKTPAAKKRKAR